MAKPTYEELVKALEEADGAVNASYAEGLADAHGRDARRDHERTQVWRNKARALLERAKEDSHHE